MRLSETIQISFQEMGATGVEALLFKDFHASSRTKKSFMSSLMAGHHTLLGGPPGVGKTTLGERVVNLLPDRKVVESCPVNCDYREPSCPWCQNRLAAGEELKPLTQKGEDRIKRISGSAELSVADIIGDLDPQSAIQYGIFDLRAFVPGKLLRANGEILLIDFIDRIRERVLNAILSALAGEGVSLGNHDQVFPLDVIIVATGAVTAFDKMPGDLADHFDLVRLNNVEDLDFEESLISDNGKRLSPDISSPAVKIIDATRKHDDLSRGVSTRGAVRYGELLSSYSQVSGLQEAKALLPAASPISLPHRVEVAPHAAAGRDAVEIIEEIVDEAVGITEAKEELISMNKDDLLAVVDEIAKQDHFRKPLKFGLFDLLLKKIKRFPESELAQLHEQMLERMMRKYQGRDMSDNLTMDLLADIETAREKNQRLVAELRAKLEAEALIKTLDMLEEKQVLTRGQRGYSISRRGISLLLERLSPRLWEGGEIMGQGKHRTGKKQLVGEGRVVGVRKWRFGDRYRDVSLKDTMRAAIRNRNREITRDDIMVVKRDIRSRMDIVLCLDMSGTMDQLEKLWYAKESAIALSLASANYQDRVGLVVFSNMGKLVSDLTSNTFRLTEKVLDLDLHDNAFTNIGFGLLTARGLFARHSRSQGKQHIILVSDGDATAPHPSPGGFAIREASKTIRKGITISCICINEENADPDLMYKIARIGRGRITLIGDTSGIREAVMEERLAASS